MMLSPDRCSGSRPTLPWSRHSTTFSAASATSAGILSTSLKLSLYLAKRESKLPASDVLGELEVCYLDVEQLFDRLQLICRPMKVTPIRALLALLIEERRRTWTDVMSADEGELTLFPPHESDVGDFDPVRLTESLDAFVHCVLRLAKLAARRCFDGESGTVASSCNGTNPAAGKLAGVTPGEPHPDPLSSPFLARVITAHGGRRRSTCMKDCGSRPHGPSSFALLTE